jgi:hypothetical protein
MPRDLSVYSVPATHESMLEEVNTLLVSAPTGSHEEKVLNACHRLLQSAPSSHTQTVLDDLHVLERAKEWCAVHSHAHNPPPTAFFSPSKPLQAVIAQVYDYVIHHAWTASLVREFRA